MIFKPSTCALINKGNCHLCKSKWVGWIASPNKEENHRLWEQWKKDQQAKHDKLWYAEIESIKLEN